MIAVHLSCIIQSDATMMTHYCAIQIIVATVNGQGTNGNRDYKWQIIYTIVIWHEEMMFLSHTHTHTTTLLSENTRAFVLGRCFLGLAISSAKSSTGLDKPGRAGYLRCVVALTPGKWMCKSLSLKALYPIIFWPNCWLCIIISLVGV